MQSNDKTLPRVFLNFYPWTHWFNRDNYYWPHTVSFVAFKTRFVFFFFLTRKAFPSCLWASLVFFFFINSTFNHGPGVMACMTGVIFFAFFRRAKASVKRARSASPVACVWLSSLASRLPKNPKTISPVMKATGVKDIGPILLISSRPRKRILGGRLGMELLPRVWNLEGLPRTKNSQDTYLVHRTLPTYPSPNPTLTLNPQVGTKCWLREGAR